MHTVALRHATRAVSIVASNRSPNTYEDSLCQETNCSRERFLVIFSALRVLVRSASGVVF